MQSRARVITPWTVALACWAMCSVSSCPIARSQELPRPTPPSTGGGAPSASKPIPVSVEQLAERLNAIEAMNRKLVEELETTRKEHHEEMRQMRLLLDRVGGTAEGAAPTRSVAPESVRAEDAVAHPLDVESPVPDYTEGQFAPFTPPPGYPLPSSPKTKSRRIPLNGTFGPGFQWQTEDEEYRLRIHYESQLELREWGQRDQAPANSGFFLPRQRIFFEGNITRTIEYEFAINRGFGALNVLNAFINFHFDDRFQLRIGRFFTPFDYDQYAISNYWLTTPERSIYTTNVGLNRQFGMMGWGYLFDKRLDYAAGLFNGSRNSFEALSNSLDFVTYLNTRPFQNTESWPLLKYLNLGTSFALGYQNQAPVPVSFRIGGGSPTADNPGPGTTPFLILNPDVVEKGERLLGSVHAAYFYKGLSLIGEWQYGYGSYASAGHPSPAQVPFSGFYATGGYFLTGEHVERRTRVNPLRPLIRTDPADRRGFGALEAVARVSRLSLGDEVFKAGFADPSLWSNSAITTELGLNWYWNEYVKIYTFWLHGEFGEPVLYRPGGFQKTADMFWLRFQLYF
jgi:phosphate-selective porin OprO and OprP